MHVEDLSDDLTTASVSFRFVRRELLVLARGGTGAKGSLGAAKPPYHVGVLVMGLVWRCRVRLLLEPHGLLELVRKIHLLLSICGLVELDGGLSRWWALGGGEHHHLLLLLNMQRHLRYHAAIRWRYSVTIRLVLILRHRA